MGLFVGLLLALGHGYTRSKRADLRFFLWLTAYVCLFANAGYFMALSFVPFGDIHGFMQGFDSPFAWQLGLTVAGMADSIVALFADTRTLDEFLGETQRRRRAAKLVLISYFAGSMPLILSTLLGKDGSYVALVSAIPATLGGTIFLPYTILCVGKAKKTTNAVLLTPGRSPASFAISRSSAWNAR